MKKYARCLIFSILGLFVACQASGPRPPLQRQDKAVPIQHSQRIVVLDRHVRNALLFVNSVQKRLPGGQILVQANFQNRFPNDDLWAEVKFEFLDGNNMLVDETEWVNTLFPRAEVTMVQGSSLSGKAEKHVMLLRKLRSSTGRFPRGGAAIYEVRGDP